MSERLFALLGSGEFEPWHVDVDRWLLDRARGNGGVLILPTASAKEGDEVFDSWAVKGLEHYAAQGIHAEVVPIKVRRDAERPEFVEKLEGASMVFFSGGNPWYLAEALRGTPFYGSMVERLGDGLAYVGCSAGVACLSETTYDSDTQDFEHVFKEGLGYMRGVVFGPHWDMIDQWIPGATSFIVGSVPDSHTFVGIDENTAMVGDGSGWRVFGASGVHVLREGEWSHLTAGASFELAL